MRSLFERDPREHATRRNDQLLAAINIALCFGTGDQMVWNGRTCVRVVDLSDFCERELSWSIILHIDSLACFVLCEGTATNVLRLLHPLLLFLYALLQDTHRWLESDVSLTLQWLVRMGSKNDWSKSSSWDVKEPWRLRNYRMRIWMCVSTDVDNLSINSRFINLCYICLFRID